MAVISMTAQSKSWLTYVTARARSQRASLFVLAGGHLELGTMNLTLTLTFDFAVNRVAIYLPSR